MPISQIVQNSLANTISLGPKITSVQVANSTYVVKDDTAINIGGGYIVITGSGFQSNCSVLVDSNLACSVAFVSATQVRAELPAKPAGTYNLYLLNGDGGTAIRVNALQYSNTPTWVTTSPLATQLEDSNVSIQLSATGANTYALQSGSTLPNGLTLSANGLISGTVNTNISIETTYNFTVEAIDTENQETPKAFAVTITVGDPYFNRTVLLLGGDGTNGKNNNVFNDSSNSNLTVTRAGGATQGSISPFSPSGWSNYFTGSGSGYVAFPANSAFDFGTGDFTIEFLFYYQSDPPAGGGYDYLFAVGGNNSNGLGIYIQGGVPKVWNGSSALSTTGSIVKNTWYHLALVRASGTLTMYLNGVSIGSASFTSNLTGGTSNGPSFGSWNTVDTNELHGYISNARIVKGTAVYTTTFTPPTSDLTAITNTSLLTCQSNRFKDNSTNNFAASVSGSPKVTNFSPFSSSTEYSVSTHGGSFSGDGNGDYVTLPSGNSSPYINGSGAFTIEWWVYYNTLPVIGGNNGSYGLGWYGQDNGSAIVSPFNIVQNGNTWRLWSATGSSSWDIYSDATMATTSLTTGQWYHIAFVRNGSTLTMYVNGVSAGSQSLSSSIWATGSYQLFLFNGWQNNASAFNGYVSDYRITKGTAVYTTNFTPPTAPLTALTNTTLLLNFQNAGIVDSTTKNTIQTIGDTKINTSVKKYSTGSIQFDGTGDYLTGFNDETIMGPGDFTWELWYYANSYGAYTGLMDSRLSDGTATGAGLIYVKGTTITYWSGGVEKISANTVAANTWYHVAAVRQSGTVNLYLNGVSTGSTADTVNMTYPLLRIGNTYDDFGLNGYIDDVRITKGYARYTANFTPPSSAFLKK